MKLLFGDCYVLTYWLIVTNLFKLANSNIGRGLGLWRTLNNGPIIIPDFYNQWTYQRNIDICN